jgi:hypothetical protein
MKTETFIHLSNDPIQENDLAALAWLDLCGHLKEACESLNTQQTHAELEISQWDSMRWMHDLRDRAELCYMRNPGHAYWLEMSFDFYSKQLRYRVTGQPPIDLQAVSDEEGKYAFRTSEGEQVSAEHLHFCMLETLLACKPF